MYGSVGIDNLAGPSEVLVVADRTARPTWIAADLLAQEEHGSGAQAVLLAESEELVRQVAGAVESLRAEMLGERDKGKRNIAPTIPACGLSTRHRERTSATWRPLWSTPTRRSTSSFTWPTRAPFCPGCARPGRSSSATAPRPHSATTWPGATTCCPPEGRHVSRLRCRWTPSCASRRTWRCRRRRCACSPRAWPLWPTARASPSTASRPSCGTAIAADGPGSVAGPADAGGAPRSRSRLGAVRRRCRSVLSCASVRARPSPAWRL